MTEHRHPAGTSTGGRFAATQHSDAEISLDGGDGHRCVRCGQFQGEVHRCPTPGLIEVGSELGVVIAAIGRTEGRPLLVGGCVRDALRGRPAGDVDIEVHGADLGSIEEALTDAGLHVDAVGRSFGVLTVRHGGDSFDISVPRRDSKVGAGHRDFYVEVDTTLDETEASARRDFTVNALMWDPISGDVIDCHGGLADLDAGVLRHTSEAFSEDPLRVLRAVRFAGQLDMELHPDTAALCAGLVDEFGALPVERVWGEWAKIAAYAPRPGRSLEVLRQVGWDRHHPELAAIHGVAQSPHWHPEGTVDVHTSLVADAAAAIADRDGLDAEDRRLLVFAAIAHDFGKATHTQVHDDGAITSRGHAEAGVAPAQQFLASIGAPSKIVDGVAPLIAEHMCASTAEGPTPKAVRRLARRLGPVPIEMWAKVVEADNQGRGVGSSPGPAGAWVRLARELAVDRAPAAPLLSGRDLIDAGMTPGPEFRTVLDAARAAQDDGEFADRDGALVWFAAHRAV